MILLSIVRKGPFEKEEKLANVMEKKNWTCKTVEFAKQLRTYRIVKTANGSIFFPNRIEAPSEISLFFVAIPFCH